MFRHKSLKSIIAVPSAKLRLVGQCCGQIVTVFRYFLEVSPHAFKVDANKDSGMSNQPGAYAPMMHRTRVKQPKASHSPS